MLQKSPSSSGSGSYVFVSYSHRDAKRVTREIGQLEQDGIPVWFDQSIRPGHRWRVELAHAIEKCSVFLIFTSKSAVASNNCAQELAYASTHNRPLLQVQLEETDLPTEFKFALAAEQAIHAWEMSQTVYLSQLNEALHSRLEGTIAPLPEIRHRDSARSNTRRLYGLVLATSAALLLAFAVKYWQSGEVSSPTMTDPPYETSYQSVAVMRFRTIGESTAIADGLCEQLLHLLAGLKEVSVPSRTSSWVATEQDLEPRKAARRLGVRFVLEGSVQQINDQLRVTAQLIDGFTGLQVWSEIYNVRLSARSFFEIQDDIASQLLSHLKVTLSKTSVTRLASHLTDNDEALKAYLNGRALRREPGTDQNIHDATLAFQQALDLDADFAEAHAALCEAYLAGYAQHRDDDKFTTAKVHCLAAQRIDESQTEVLIALGTLYRHEGRLQNAEVVIDKARQLEPRNTAAMEEHGRLLRIMGRSDAAEAVFEESIRTEPANWSVHKSMGNFLVRSGRYTEAVGLYKQSLRLDPGNTVSENNLATALHLAGQFVLSAELWIKISTESPSYLTFLNLANSRFYEGAYEEAVNWYGRAIKISDTDFRGFGGRASSLEYARGADAARSDYKRAAELALLAAERNRNDAQTLSRLSFYQAKLGQDVLARSGLARLAGLPQLDPTARFMLALTHITLGDMSAARLSLEEAIAAGFPTPLVEADPLAAQILDPFGLAATVGDVKSTVK